MKRFKSLVLSFFCFCLVSAGAAWGASSVTITSGNAVRGPWYGFGVDWQTYTYSSSTPSSTDWTNTYVPRLQWMKPGIVRLLMSISYINPSGTYNYSTSQMTQLYRVLDYCQANNIPVALTEWGSGWPAAPSGWKIGDTNYTNAIGAYMQYLTQTKGYTCIKWFILGNEPNYSPADFSSVSSWATAVTTLKNKFTSLGLSGFTIAGPDSSDADSWVTSVASSYNSLVGAYDMHRYEASSYLSNSGFETNLTSTVWNSVISSDQNQDGKTFIIGEAGIADGMSTDTNTNIATYNYGLWMADYGVQAARAKIGGIAAWNIDNDGVNTQNWGLWSSKATGYELRPWWYTWSLLSHCVPAGSTIYAPSNPSSSVRVMGAQTTSGEWTFVAVNQGSSSVDLNFIAPGNTQQTFSRYLYSSSSQLVDSNGIPTASSTIQSTPSAGVSCTVPATSVIVLTSVGASAVSSSVSITAPASGATVSGNVSVTATATDSVGVTKVELYVDGALSGTDTTTPYNFTWDSTLITAGSYTLMAKAYNTAGNAVQSDNVSVTVVNDTTTPTVSVIIPANNATVSGTVMISASASDNVGVSKVEFYEDGVLLTATNVAPYSYNWNTATVANGTHSLTAKAYDASTNVGQSSIVAVTVSNSSLDTTASTVSITAPANNATVRGTVSVIASATDNIGVVKVEFYVNGVLKKTDTAAPYTFNWNTTTLVDGSYTLLAKAYDAANNIGQSSNVTVTLNNPDTTAPTISITAPANNATVRGTVSVIASATDYIGVVKVEFYVNGVLKKTDTATPYSYIWNTRSIGKGNYTITAKAYDAAGNVGQSLAISVTVRW